MLDSRASILEEARAELRTRAERAERELDQVRAELAELRRTASARPGAGIARPSRDARAFTRLSFSRIDRQTERLWTLPWRCVPSSLSVESGVLSWGYFVRAASFHAATAPVT